MTIYNGLVTQLPVEGDGAFTKAVGRSHITEAGKSLSDPVDDNRDIAFTYPMCREDDAISYGPNRPALWRQAALLTDTILRGAKPGDLPVEQPTKFGLVINLQAERHLYLALVGALETGLVRTMGDALAVLRQANRPLGPRGAEWLQAQARRPQPPRLGSDGPEEV
jgi:hypothetical protein